MKMLRKPHFPWFHQTTSFDRLSLQSKNTVIEKKEKVNIFLIQFQKMSKDHFLHVYWYQRTANNAYFNNQNA